jgi:hypothetical protein
MVYVLFVSTVIAKLALIMDAVMPEDTAKVCTPDCAPVVFISAPSGVLARRHVIPVSPTT